MRRGVDAERVRALALALGFDLAGIAPAEATPGADRLRRWVAAGYAASMDYIERRLEDRLDARRLLPGARSAIAVGLLYGAQPERAEGDARIARYAGGDDYHEVVMERLLALAHALEALAERVRWRAYVDTGPVQERAWAARAGLGWIGKNACLIHPRLGSYLYLGILFTDLVLSPDEPEPDHCGTCRACLDACPTDAFPEPGVVDSRRCLAHATIEDPGPVPEALRGGQGAWVFGCDLCQEVCPWNRGVRVVVDPLGLRERLAPRDPWRRVSLAWLLGLEEDAWRKATRHTALRRARHRALLRNALVAAGNSRDPSLRDLVARHAAGDDPVLAEHARWALARLADV